jgi:hypothetical protein
LLATIDRGEALILSWHAFREWGAVQAPGPRLTAGRRTVVDGREFDRWVQWVGVAMPRRRAFAGLGAAVVAPLLLAAGSPEAAARNHKKHKKSCPACPPSPTCPTCPTIPTCRSGEDYCAGFGTPPCGAGCRCLSRLIGGETICANYVGLIQCGDCDTDADCVAFGPGAFCANGSGPNCCDAPDRGFCAAPCAS